MMEAVTKILPNVVTKIPELIQSCWQTLYMVFLSGIISIAIGVIIGVVLVVTKKDGILEQKIVFHVVDKIINVIRSIPFVILLAMLIPLTRVMVGSAIGTKGAIVPLVFGTVPFFSRQIESALSEVDGGLIEAAQSMGLSPVAIIVLVYLRESIPGIVRGTTITIVSLIGLTAMAGAIGGGGLGDFAIRYGHQRNQLDVTYVTVVILLLVVGLIQAIGNLMIKKTTH